MDEAASTALFNPETLEKYFRASHPTRHPLSNAPECVLIVEPSQRLLKLRTPATDSLADVGAYDRLAFDIVEEPGEEGLWFELSIDGEGMAYEGYALIMSIVDQLEAGRPFRHSVADALATYRELLTRRRGLSEEQEVGLFGELGLFIHLVETIGEEAATAAWLGPENEEHDFVLLGYDIEAKSTRSEARVHVIGSMTQLARSPERPLFLVSMQFTAGGGAAGGETLVERVERVRTALTRGRGVFDQRLRSLGWDDRHAAAVYKRRYLSRSEPRCYEVNAEFPAIGADAIAAVMSRPELVVGLIYRIDVTTLPASTPTVELVDFCERSTTDGS